ncbi:MAG: YihY/virulence factor BrkB family protein [Chloroflexi bacterium]|nr:YihY/virulence factor BrkB family protein [Chloroflexota bacterium]
MNLREYGTVVKATVHEFGKDDVGSMAASLTYFVFFSIFPLLILAVTLGGIFLNPQDATRFIFETVARVLPGSVQPLEDALNTAFKNQQNAGWVALAGLLALVFSASGAFSALDNSINRAWQSEKVPNFLSNRLTGLAMMLAMVLVLLASLIVTAALTSSRAFTTAIIGRVPGDQIFWQVVNFLASIAIVFVVFLLMYRFLPRADVKLRDIWVASLVAAILWAIVKEIFAYYVGSPFANFARYGPFATTFALLTWIYLSSVIILVGAEFSSETARVRRLRPKKEGEAKPQRKKSPWLPVSEK